ncbi:MAG: COX15/CtaA family protein [Balneolaceae bacterium]
MKYNLYQKVAFTTVAATILLIFVGGLVRAAGAGLGCPDWPTCFGLWIPPLDAVDLPAGYDTALYNPLHTWLEYFNRLVGVTIGLLITATFILSFRYRKSDSIIVWVSATALILVLLQGWLGGVVVQSGLSTGMITLHMILAMLILNLLLYAAVRATREKFVVNISEPIAKRLMWLGGFLFLLLLVQMILGTQVREMVDLVKNAPNPPPREMWPERIDNTLYLIHRSFSWLVVTMTALLVWDMKRSGVKGILRRLAMLVCLLITLQILLGAGMEWFGMPGWMQLFHLVGFALLICTHFFYLLILHFSRQ